MIRKSGFYYENSEIKINEQNPKGILAGDQRLVVAANNVIKPEKSTSANVIPTLNKDGGYMDLSLTPSMQAVVNLVTNKIGQQWDIILDIGSAYGVAALALLAENKNITIIANDVGAENLLVLSKEIDKKDANRVFLNSNNFVDLQLDKNSIDCTLLSRVLHFLTPEQAEYGLKNIYDWLKPGGYLSIETASIFTKFVSNSKLQKQFNNNKAAGTKWPGFFNKNEFDSLNLENLPEVLHVVDLSVLIKNLMSYGFEIEEARYLDRGKVYPTAALGGKEALFVLAYKPITSR